MRTRRNLLRAAAAGAGLGVISVAGTGTASAAGSGTALGWLDVTAPEYGATGDGRTDDTAAIQNALKAAAPGDVVFFPNGKYQISAPLEIPDGVELQGSGSSWYSAGGSNQTTINAVSSFTAAQIPGIRLATAPRSR
ncbi:glycosyl hydrolase family 28-related protein [Nonomuraea sp. NPDC049152]|uniref:glycosyl hydrolase family 28-related protein n=1 Tax=Nonomuraea sp. NPDC049152 TaxID=3154350 RepID=UPI0033E64BCB